MGYKTPANGNGKLSEGNYQGEIIRDLMKNGRSGGIRTHDPYTPSIVRYQAALRSGRPHL